MESAEEVISSKPSVSTLNDLLAYDDDSVDTSSSSSSGSSESESCDNLDECTDACTVAQMV